MKWSRSLIVPASALVALGALLLRADLTSWAENTVAGGALEAAFFRMMDVPAGPVLARRVPAESRVQLTSLIQKAPRRPDLYALRAQEDERQLAIKAAEADWKQAAALSTDKTPALIDLANFYHRRVEPENELKTLVEAGKQQPSGRDRFKRQSSQASWQAFTRALNVASASLLPAITRNQVYESWIAAYPQQKEPYLAYFRDLIKHTERDEATGLAARIKSAFPNDEQIAVETEAELAGIEQGPSGVLKAYARQFSPLWPEPLRTSYYRLLSQQHQLRAFLSQARAEAVAHPTDLDPVFRLFFISKASRSRKPPIKCCLSSNPAAKLNTFPGAFPI